MPFVLDNAKLTLQPPERHVTGLLAYQEVTPTTAPGESVNFATFKRKDSAGDIVTVDLSGKLLYMLSFGNDSGAKIRVMLDSADDGGTTRGFSLIIPDGTTGQLMAYSTTVTAKIIGAGGGTVYVGAMFEGRES